MASAVTPFGEPRVRQGAGSTWCNLREGPAPPNSFIRSNGGPLVGGLRDLGGRLFPERQILLRSTERVRLVLLPSWLQAMIVIACIGTFGGVSYLAVGYFAMHRALDQVGAAPRRSHVATDAVNAPAAPSDNALAALNQQLAAVNAQYTVLKQRYDAAVANQSTSETATDQAQQDLQQKLDSAEQQLAANNGNVAQLKRSIDDLRAHLKQAEQARVAEKARAHQLEVDMQTLTARANLLKAIVDSKDEQLAKLRSQLAKPGEQLGAAPSTAPGASAPAAKPAVTSGAVDPQKHSALVPDALVNNPGTVEPAPQVAQLGPDRGDHRPTSELERVLASTGVDIDKLLRRISPSVATGASGGPFVALDSMRSNALERRRVAALLKVAKLLPLRPPLGVRYEIGSPFGPRFDPFNHRAAFHTGIDLDASYRAPVYSTAPGVVIFTGWKEGYGRTVEVDHGHGIVTLYAHLHRIMAARGERVAAHVEIGQLGSTGRSTGPHLHYEIRLDGRPVNPEKFLEAGKNVVRASAH
ncbi:MAG: peptidoglycan DD-metalloendopeptidase family protein [Alphaproteobacteria bacterium]|nr:peptidoglycan DD-metalloendopeptidase family protein [Alphaproteobacteria bacterium]